jgi:hypothetical protein
MTGDARRVAIWRLHQAIGRGLVSEVAKSGLVLVVTGNPKAGTRTLTVRCAPRPADGGRLWFWLAPSPGQGAKPLIEADQLADAVLSICGERQIRGQQAAPFDLRYGEIS